MRWGGFLGDKFNNFFLVINCFSYFSGTLSIPIPLLANTFCPLNLLIYVRYTRLWRINHWIWWISLFVTKFSARFFAILGESHFFHWIQWHFCPWFFCSYYFALCSVNFIPLTWSLKEKEKKFVTTIQQVSPRRFWWVRYFFNDVREETTSNNIAKFEENVAILGKKIC